MDVAIFIGSDSDYEVVKEALEVLREFRVSFSLEVTSAHRSPRRTLELIQGAEKEGAEVFIAVAGKAAHLAGVVAAHTVRPVIGVPVESAGLNGLDALLSTIQMPKGVPVAAMGLGKTGATNAALLAIQILSVRRPELRAQMHNYRENMAAQVAASSLKVKKGI